MWAGKVDARHVIYLAEHLVLNPHSRVFAIRGGSPELQGWDAATVVAVRAHNLIASLLQGLAGQKDPAMFIDWPGRDAEKELSFEPKTIAELLAGTLDNFINE